ncbi:protein phosphatase 1 regulatory subunit 3C [Salminus brasiliensis]|uniref:protein phosphatase 1 regulatory subunit 3C n=1 Tax=Salminus brasiliensis TaxID=930266 RepID=UPI003B83019D
MAAAKVMPLDLVMHMGMSRRHAVRQRLEMPSDVLRYQHTLPRTSKVSTHPARAATPPLLPPSPISPMSTSSSVGTLKKKKRVVFADDKGLALTAVRLFTVDPPESTSDAVPQPKKLKDQTPVQPRTLRLQLGFPQPSADLPSFLKGLADSLVRLETCSLMGGSLTGMVRVCNISQEKSVHIRITFDSWRSHQDIPCTYIQQHPGSATELFVFNVPFPSDLNLQERVEFRVLFRPGSGSTLLWDNNGGQSYRILVEVVDPEDVPVQNRPFKVQSLQWPQVWPKRKSQVVNYSPVSSPENMIKPLSRQEIITPLC